MLKFDYLFEITIKTVELFEFYVLYNKPCLEVSKHSNCNFFKHIQPKLKTHYHDFEDYLLILQRIPRFTSQQI